VYAPALSSKPVAVGLRVRAREQGSSPLAAHAGTVALERITGVLHAAPCTRRRREMADAVL